MIADLNTEEILATDFCNGSKHNFQSLTIEQKAKNREPSKKRILIENIIRKLKIFRILSERYRNRRKRFGLRFNRIAAIYNLELKSPSNRLMQEV